jgi:uncharacterized protein YhaN
MWIEEIFLESFGGFKGFGLTLSDASMNLLLGPNEAGKSTIVEFVRSLFFGFKKRRGTVNSYDTPDGALRAGWMTVHVKGAGRVRVERREQPGNKEGLLTVVDEQGTALDPSSIPIPGRGIDRTAFEALFAFDVDGIRSLDREKLTGRILGSALGSLHVNPVDVARAIEERLKGLTKRSTRDERSLFAIKSRIGEIDAELRELREKPARCARLKDELASVTARRRGIASKILDNEKELERLTGLLGRLDAWDKVLTLDREIAALDDCRDFPANGALRLEQALERRGEAEENLRKLTAKTAELLGQPDRHAPDAVLLDHRDAIGVLDEKARDLSSRPSEMESLRAEALRAAEALDEEIAKLGQGWDRKRIARFDSSVVPAGKVDRFAEEWGRIRKRIRELEQRSAENQGSIDRLADRIEQREQAVAALREESRAFLLPETRDLLARWKDCEKSVGYLRTKLFDRKALLQKLDPERRDAARAYRRIERESARGWYWAATAGLGILLISGAGLLVRSWTVQPESGQWAASAGGPALAVAAAALLVMVTLRERGLRARARRDKAALKEKLALISKEMNMLAKEQSDLMEAVRHRAATMARIAGEVLGNPHADRKDVLDAEKRSSLAEESYHGMQAAEELLRSELADLSARESEREEILERLDRANREFGSLRSEWQTLLNEGGLDSALEPARATELIRRVDVLKKQLRGVRARSETLRGMEREYGEFTDEVRALALRMERPDDLDQAPGETVARWRRGLREAREALARTRSLEERIQDLETNIEVVKGKILRAEREIESLLESAGAADEKEFRDKEKRHDCRTALDRERRMLVDSLISGLALEDETALRAFMAAEDPRESARARQELQTATLRLREESEDLAARSGSLGGEIESLENEEETDRLLAAREELIARLNETVGKWITLKQASVLLGTVLERYESRKQPRIVKRSSEIFNMMTSSAFGRIILPMDRNSIAAEREDGTRIGEALLSRGTLEQLYLSLRLAHLEIDRTEGDSAPLIMDDVLVNFDPDRARRTSEILTEFSRNAGIQVLYLTCHPHVADLFPGDVPRIELHDGEIAAASHPAAGTDSDERPGRRAPQSV